MVREDGSFVNGPANDDAAGEATKRSLVFVDEADATTPEPVSEPLLEPSIVTRRASQFDALHLKGRPMF